jgi:hypothetical protein
MKFSVSLILAWLIYFFLTGTGCAKEYSYEAGPKDTIISDTILVPPPPKPPWICPACIDKDKQIESKWSFYTDSAFYCGDIDTAIVIPERTGFTFYGPSSCSADSGMVITVFMDGMLLDRDYRNISTRRVGFYYYDNVAGTLMLVTKPGNNFTVHFDSYVHATRMATGSFRGNVFRPDGSGMLIGSGKFKIKLL